MEARILAVEDRLRWIENFQSWIPKELATVEAAQTAEEARDLLRRKHYDVVLLDLSMTPDPQNRDNEGIQSYLSLGQEQTKYIVISGHIDITEVREAAFRRNAFDVIFKDEAEPQLIRDRVTAALDTMGDWRRTFLPAFKKQLVPDEVFETEALSVLRPRGGVPGFTSALEYLARALVPTAPHTSRRGFKIRDQALLALVWSRRQGQACSLAMANESMPSEELTARLTDWLGFAGREPLVEDRVIARVRVQCHRESGLTDQHFELPEI